MDVVLCSHLRNAASFLHRECRQSERLHTILKRSYRADVLRPDASRPYEPGTLHAPRDCHALVWPSRVFAAIHTALGPANEGLKVILRLTESCAPFLVTLLPCEET